MATKAATKKCNENYRRRHPIRMLLGHARRRAAEKGLAFDLCEADIVIPDVCPVLGIPIIIDTGRGQQPYAPSIDRLDNKKGYTRDNVRCISWRANELKANGTLDELVAVCVWIAEQTA